MVSSFRQHASKLVIVCRSHEFGMLCPLIQSARTWTCLLQCTVQACLVTVYFSLMFEQLASNCDASNCLHVDA